MDIFRFYSKWKKRWILLKLDRLILSLSHAEQEFAKQIRKLSLDEDLHNMFINEAKLVSKGYEYVIKTLCHYCSEVSDNYNRELNLSIKNDSMINFDGKLNITFHRLLDMDATERLNLFKIVTLYDKSEIATEKFGDADKPIYEDFIKGYGEHRIRFIFHYENAMRSFESKILNFIDDFNYNNRIKPLLKNLSYNDKDRLFDIVNTMDQYKKYTDVLKKAFIFACSIKKTRFSEFVNYVEFALALYKKEYEKVRNASALKVKNPNQRFNKPTKISLPPKIDSWKDALGNIQVVNEWRKWNKIIENDIIYLLRTDNFRKRTCAVYSKKCNILVGFKTKSSFIYHLVKHAPSISMRKYMNNAMDFVSDKKVKVNIRYSQYGDIRLVTFYSKEKPGLLVINLTYDGSANITTYMPDNVKYISP